MVRVPYGGKYEISNTQWYKGEDHAKHIAIAVSVAYNLNLFKFQIIVFLIQLLCGFVCRVAKDVIFSN